MVSRMVVRETLILLYGGLRVRDTRIWSGGPSLRTSAPSFPHYVTQFVNLGDRRGHYSIIEFPGRRRGHVILTDMFNDFVKHIWTNDFRSKDSPSTKPLLGWDFAYTPYLQLETNLSSL